MCGLKLLAVELNGGASIVTPFVGVWIETFGFVIKVEMMSVTPFVGVWIETQMLLASK